MLSVLLLLAAGPQSAIPELADTPTPPSSPGGPTMRIFGETTPGCVPAVVQARDQTRPGSGLMWRDDADAVGLYRLLDRRVNGCPAPIIVNYRVPGSNALGREVGRQTPPTPTLVRRP